MGGDEAGMARAVRECPDMAGPMNIDAALADRPLSPLQRRSWQPTTGVQRPAGHDPLRSFKSMSWTRSFAGIMIDHNRRLAVKARRNVLLAVGDEVGRLHLCEVAAVRNCDGLVGRVRAEQRRCARIACQPWYWALPFSSRCRPAWKLFAQATSI